MSRRNSVERDDRTQDEDFLFKERIVLFTIVCANVSNGIIFAIQGSWLKEVPTGLILVWSLSATALPMLSIIFFSLVSEVHGRKPVFITLFALSIVSNILHCLPWPKTLASALVFQGMIRGGTSVMSKLAITEYCSPKHRLTYLMLNAVVLNVVVYLTTIVLTIKTKSYPYIQTFEIVLVLACLISTRKWPESPYWLASQGRLEDSREAFFWLRGKEARKELRSVMEERRSPGPFNLYWVSCFVSIATISVAVCTSLGGRFWFQSGFRLKDLVMENSIRLCGSIVILFLISFTSYYIKRRVLFILVTGISVILSYAVVIWMHIDPTVEDQSNRFFFYVFFTYDVISTSGPMVLALTLYIEVIPLKYNTHMACVATLCNYIIYFPFKTLFWRSFSDFESSHVYLPLMSSLSLFGVIVYYCYAPETRDKTLLEIQKMYTPELSGENSKEDVTMTHI